jgi:Ceramidase
MRWTEPVFQYCERGNEVALWAEPLNVLSNLAFLAVAVVAGAQLHFDEVGTNKIVRWLLVINIALIGLGSAAFHLLATRWARMIDVVPIGGFMALYLGFALRVFHGRTRTASVAGVVIFLAVTVFASLHTYRPGVAQTAHMSFLNGALGYLPALGVLIVTATGLHCRGHAAATWLIGACVVFTVGLALRTVDLHLCPLVQISTLRVSAHAVWHLLVALVAYLLVSATRYAPLPAAHARDSFPDADRCERRGPIEESSSP